MATGRNVRGQRNLEDALNSMLRTDYIPLRDTLKLNQLADYYIDYFGYLGDILGETDQLIVGRRGTGKTTIFYRALVECMRSWGEDDSYEAKPRALGIYIDLEKCQSLTSGTLSSFSDFEHAFTSEVCDALRVELTRSWPALSQSPTLFTKLFRSAEAQQVDAVRAELKRLADVLRTGVPRFVELAGPVTTTRSAQTKRTRRAAADLRATPLGPAASAGVSGTREATVTSDVVTSHALTYRLTVSDILNIIGQLREAAGIPHVLLFIDEFSSLPATLQAKFTTLLKKLLGNHVGLFIKLGAITDNYYLGSAIILQRDLFELSLDLDAFVERSGSLGAAMSELEKVTRRIVEERLSAYSAGKTNDILEDPLDAWTELSKSAMGVPRTIGIVLKQAWSHAAGAGQTRIRRTDIAYGIRYASKAYFNQMDGASRNGVAVPTYVRRDWDALLERATLERGNGKPASHFMVRTQSEGRLRYLNMFFLIHLLTQGRTTKKERATHSLYSFDYGVCLENNLGWGSDKNLIRQQRFAYDGELAPADVEFETDTEGKYCCTTCGTTFRESDLEVGALRLTFCPTDKSDLVRIGSLPTGNAYTEEEAKIVGAIRSATLSDRLVARQVADDVGCYVQKVSRFGDKLASKGLIGLSNDRDLGKRIYFAAPEA